MSEDKSVGEQGADDSEVFDEWLAQTAESKGVPKKELMDQMLSSYWILDELTELVEGEKSEQRSSSISPDPTESEPTTDTTSEKTTADDGWETPTAPEKDDGPTDGRAGAADTTPSEDNIREIQMAIQELIESQWATELQRPPEDEPPEPSEQSVSGDEGTDDIAEVQQQVETLASELDDVETRQESQFERLSGELQVVLDRIDELERHRDRYADENDLTALADKFNDLNERFEMLRTATDELESEMDREFDSIEELFGRVLGALDDLESDIEAATDSYKKELEPIQQREAERKQLESLQTEALNRGVRKGVCESCSQDIDLTLLSSPTCPNCGAHLIGIDDGGWNPFRPATFETDAALSDRDTLQRSQK
jgi:DNA repair exonuclease SbcCD ATPase subunit